MKVSEVIKDLQEFMEENGDIECYCVWGGGVYDELKDCNSITHKPKLSSEYFFTGLDNDGMRIFERVCILN